MATYPVRATLERVLAGELPWLHAARDLWLNEPDWGTTEQADEISDAEDGGAWLLILAMWDRDAMTNPQNINYPFLKREWTAEMDARVLRELREELNGKDDAA